MSGQFPKYLEKHGLRRIRFHDLRHSCASLLLANGVPLKQIQEWLGHSDFSTTANVYSHLDYSAKIASSIALENGLPLPDRNFSSNWVGSLIPDEDDESVPINNASISLMPINKRFDGNSSVPKNDKYSLETSENTG